MAGWWFQPTPLKNDGVKVSWDDDIPNWMESHKIPWLKSAPTRIIRLIFVYCFGRTSPAHQANHYDILATIRADKNMNHQQHQKWMGFPNIFKPLFTAFLSMSLVFLYILGSPLSLFNQLGVIVSEVLKYVKNVTESFQIDRNFDLFYIYIYYVSVK